MGVLIIVVFAILGVFTLVFAGRAAIVLVAAVTIDAVARSGSVMTGGSAGA
jgi:hypothetical protein